MESVSSGIAELDAMLGGGLIKGKTYLLEYSVGSKPLSFVSAFLKKGYLANELCKVDSFDYPFTEIMIELENTKFEALKAANEARLLTTDYMSGMIYGADASGPVITGKGELDIRGAVRISQLAWEKLDGTRVSASGLRQAIHSLSSFIRNFGFEDCLRYVSREIIMVRKRGGVLIATVNPDMLTPVNLVTLEEAFDGIIETCVAEEKMKFQKYVRIKNSPYPFFRQEKLLYEIVGEESRVSIGLQIAQDFESFKANLRMTRPGVVDVLGERFYLQSARGLAILHRDIFQDLGYEKGYDMLYRSGFEDVAGFIKPFTDKMKVGIADLIAPNAPLRLTLAKFINSRGFGDGRLLSYDPKADIGYVRFDNSPVASELHDYGKPVDAFIAGGLAAAVESVIRKRIVCKELKCLAKGDEYCEFQIALAK